MFDLEKSIREWKKNFRKLRVYEDGTIQDLEIHLLDTIDGLKKKGYDDDEAFQKAVIQVGSADGIAPEYDKNRKLALNRRSPLRLIRFIPALEWNYVKIAIRKIKRHKGYSFINIAGLAAGMTCVLLILTYVRHELSYDRYHHNADRIYRIAAVSHVEGYGEMLSTPPRLAESLISELPDVESSARLRRLGLFYVRADETIYKEPRVFFADQKIFEIFSIAMVAGGSGGILDEPNVVIISEKIAQKYFGENDPINKTVVLSQNEGHLQSDENNVYRVVGVFQEIPRNSHFHADLLASFSDRNASQPHSWLETNSLTYFMAGKGADARDLETKIQALIDRHKQSEAEASMGREKAEPYLEARRDRIFLQPLTSIHLNSHTSGELEPGGNMRHIKIFTAIAVLILMIACINFINLATARAGMRAREVGIRKVVGSSRLRLIRQFLIETGIMTFIAFLLALGAARLLIPFFNQLTGRDLTINPVSNSVDFLLFISVFISVAILSGLYPALILASAKPVSVLKGKSYSGFRGKSLRQGLVIFQFTAGLILMSGTFLISRQISYIRNSDPGYLKEQVLVLHDLFLLGAQAGAFKQEILKSPGTLNVSLTGNPPGMPEYTGVLGGIRLSGPDGPTPPASINIFSIDEDYIKTLGMSIVYGRNFSPEMPTDSGSIIINETAAKKYGLKDPLGYYFMSRIGERWEISDEPIKYTVIGVVKDFHFDSMRKKIEPLVLFSLNYDRFAAIRLQAGGIDGKIESIRRIWDSFVPGQPMQYSFLDDRFNSMYKNDLLTERILGGFTVLSVLIAALGLFGLAAFTAEQRTKEIGIRKVLGASIKDNTGILIKEFMLLAGVSNLIAAPVSFLIMSKWLQGFFYRIGIGLEPFVLAGLLSLLITFLTVGGQALKASLADPVKSLRYE